MEKIRILKMRLTDPETKQPWTVIVSKEAEEDKTKYSLDDALVSFYDGRYPDFTIDVDGDKIGQFVSQYYLHTLLEGYGGINLHGSEPSWSVSGSLMGILRSLLIGYEMYGKGE